MENNKESPESVKFPEKTQPCSWLECLQGHVFPCVLALAKCPGCQSLVLAAKMENCPFCNEPVAKMILRHDHIPHGGGVAPRCRGAEIYGETMNIEIAREGWKQTIQGEANEGKINPTT